MARSLFLLKGVSDFAPGAFENTAVESGCIQLGARGGEYLTRGSYTSPSMRLIPFTQLLASWNADTPAGTTVEVQARVAAGGKWSEWLSFGDWSPFVYRASVESQPGDGVAHMEADRIVAAQGPCDTAQLRIILHTQDGTDTPKVRLLGAATLPHKAEEDNRRATSLRQLPVPQYSCLVRDPAINLRIASATSLTMLMNRWGEDVLPEETARALYDTQAGSFGNLAFLTAAGGMYGYECYTQYCDMNTLRREVQHGYAVAAQVRYRARALGEETGEIALETDGGPPVWEHAVSDTAGHFVVVRGFFEEEGETFVFFNDPLATTDAEVGKRAPVEQFAAMYTGIALFLHRGPKDAGTAKPQRRLTEIGLQDGEIALSVRGELLQPGQSIPVKSSRATIAYTLSDGVAYASAAQKTFYYISPEADGRIPFDPAPAAGRKLMFYLIGSRGTTWVAEKSMPQVQPDKPETEGEDT